MNSAPKPRPKILIWWEDLSVLVQIGVVGPISIVIISWLHIILFVPNISVGRAIGYGIFWGAMVTFALVGATRAERARRLAGQRAAARSDHNDS